MCFVDPGLLGLRVGLWDALVRLGLTYKKVNSIPKRNSPDFLLTTSLELDNTKMRDARACALPVVLLGDITTAKLGGALRAWRWRSEEFG